MDPFPIKRTSRIHNKNIIFVINSSSNQLTPINLFDNINITNINMGCIYKNIYSNIKTQQFWSFDNKTKQFTTLNLFIHSDQTKVKTLFVNRWNTDSNPYYMSNTDALYQSIHLDTQESISTNLKNVIDMKRTLKNNLVLCTEHKLQNGCIVLKHWQRDIKSTVPREMIKLILKFYHNTQIYQINNTHSKKIHFFEDKKILKIEAGYLCFLLLDSKGILWKYHSCSSLSYKEHERRQRFVKFGNYCSLCDVYFENNQNLKQHLNSKKHSNNIPIQIDYFFRNKIAIKDISSGNRHFIAMDNSNKIYSWGFNGYGQLGHNTNQLQINAPKLIESLLNYNIIQIKCGDYHSYAMSNNKLHFLFGDNQNNQCLVFENDKNKISIPFIINDIVKQQTNGAEIIEIFLGCKSTQIIVNMNDIELSRMRLEYREMIINQKNERKARIREKIEKKRMENKWVNYCSLCDVYCGNNDRNWKEHLNGKKHAIRMMCRNHQDTMIENALQSTQLEINTVSTQLLAIKTQLTMVSSSLVSNEKLNYNALKVNYDALSMEYQRLVQKYWNLKQPQ